MRGARFHLQEMLPAGRIIPADAGSTGYPVPNHYHMWDHSRGCGEHLTYNWNSQFEQGSSPRMRGALARAMKVSRLARIIPADAGSTQPG